MTGNRFYIEDRAWMLDKPGEFFVLKTPEGGAVVCLWPPDGAGPAALNIEAGRSSLSPPLS